MSGRICLVRFQEQNTTLNSDSCSTISTCARALSRISKVLTNSSKNINWSTAKQRSSEWYRRREGTRAKRRRLPWRSVSWISPKGWSTRVTSYSSSTTKLTRSCQRSLRSRVRWTITRTWTRRHLTWWRLTSGRMPCNKRGPRTVLQKKNRNSLSWIWRRVSSHLGRTSTWDEKVKSKVASRLALSLYFSQIGKEAHDGSLIYYM